MNDLFSGYACIFNEIDLGNDVVMPSAFERSLSEKKPQDISMLWQHDPNLPIGRWEEFKVDEKGLYVVGRLSIAVRQALDVANLIADNVIDGLSIGFKTRRAVQRARESTRYIHEVDLWEISVVTFPMQPAARIEGPAARIEQPADRELPTSEQPEADLKQRILRASNAMRA